MCPAELLKYIEAVLAVKFGFWIRVWHLVQKVIWPASRIRAKKRFKSPCYRGPREQQTFISTRFWDNYLINNLCFITGLMITEIVIFLQSSRKFQLIHAINQLHIYHLIWAEIYAVYKSHVFETDVGRASWRVSVSELPRGRDWWMAWGWESWATSAYVDRASAPSVASIWEHRRSLVRPGCLRRGEMAQGRKAAGKSTPRRDSGGIALANRRRSSAQPIQSDPVLFAYFYFVRYLRGLDRFSFNKK